METKVCKRCGRELSVDHFRNYYGGRKGSYSFCKTCEKIEQRRKYLACKERTATISAEEQIELDKINKLYDAHQAAGRQVPVRRPDRGVTYLVDQLMPDIK